jgi:hypothetical protein
VGSGQWQQFTEIERAEQRLAVALGYPAMEGMDPPYYPTGYGRLMDLVEEAAQVIEDCQARASEDELP